MADDLGARQLASLSNMLLVEKHGHHLSIRLDGPFSDTAPLSIRRQKAEKATFNLLRRQGQARWLKKEGCILLAASSPGSLLSIGAELEQMLREIARRPMTPRELLAVLPITNRERVRWTKDGRLPPSGSVAIKRGQLISIPTYAVALIDRILASPDMVAKWRAYDDRMEASGTSAASG